MKSDKLQQILSLLTRAFTKSESGHFAVTLGVALLPVALTAGLALDYSRISNTRTKLQIAADSAALAAAIGRDMPEAQRKILAREMFDSNYHDHEIKAFGVTVKDEMLAVRVSTELPMTFMKLAGYETTEIGVMAQAVLDLSDVEVALVLDISGSMRNKLKDGMVRSEALRSAALKLVDELEEQAPTKSRIAVVPFTMNVNIGTENAHLVAGEDHSLFSGTKWMGCVQELAPPNHVADLPKTQVHAYVWPPAPNSTGMGAVCKNPGDGTNAAYKYLQEADPKFASDPARSDFDGPNRNCVRFPLKPLTNDFDAVRAHLKSFVSVPNDGTIIAPGVTWGLRLLSPGAPFTQGNKWSPSNRKYMIVITDGAQTTEIEYQPKTCNKAVNTVTPYKFDPAGFNMAGKVLADKGPVDNWGPYGYLLDSDPFGHGVKTIADLPGSLQKLSLAACDEARKTFNGGTVEIFTIGVSEATKPGTAIHDLLRACASRPENHFYVTDQKSVQKAFDSITSEVLRLRLTQ